MASSACDPLPDDSLALVPTWLTKKGAGRLRTEQEPASTWYDENSWNSLSRETRTKLRAQADLYPSRPLREEPCEIRLLRVLPGEWGDQMRCQLHITTWRDCPEYEALSYTWGSSNEHRTIILDGLKGFAITDNAFSALRRFRYKSRPRLIWVDAICISQGNIKERQQQVSIMGSIYKNAVRCLVWLGEWHHASTEVTAYGSVNHRPRDAQDEARILEALDFVYWHSKPRWWERTWVIQEVALSREVLVCFASFQFPWGHFCWDLLRVATLGGPRRQGHEGYPHHLGSSNEYPVRQSMWDSFNKLCTTRLLAQDSETSASLSNLLRYTRSAACSDLRDKAYSILSMIDRREAALLPPMYDIPWAEVYAKTTYASIAVQQNLNILHYREDESGPIGFPSEVPTWAVNLQRSSPGDVDLHRLSERQGREELSEWRDGDKNHFLAELSFNAALLKVRGYKLDVVAKQMLHVQAFGKTTVKISEEVLALLVTAVTDQQASRSYDLIASTRGGSDCSKNLAPQSDSPGTAIDQSRFQALQKATWRRTGFPMTFREAFGEACSLWNEAAGIPDEFVHGRDESLDQRSLDVAGFCRHARIVSAAADSILFTTEAGFMGIATMRIRVGDVVALLYGCNSPVVLQPRAQNYEFRGFAYVHGIMYNELKSLGLSDNLVRQEFSLC